MDYADVEDLPETANLDDDEIVGGAEIIDNNERLKDYVARIREITRLAREAMIQKGGDYVGMLNANHRQEWLEDFSDLLYDTQDFGKLSLDIMDAVLERFALVEAGAFERGATGWPTIWFYEEQNRDIFLKQVRWFSSNHGQQFGRLLTPLVDGIRVCGSFQPSAVELRDEHRLVLLDGEGLGHSAKEATSVSTKVTEKFPGTDLILLVDTCTVTNASSPSRATEVRRQQRATDTNSRLPLRILTK